MNGICKGLVTRLKGKLSQALYLEKASSSESNHCHAHRLDLAYAHAFWSIVQIRNALGTVASKLLRNDMRVFKKI